MAVLQFAPSAYDRGDGLLSSRLVNMYTEIGVDPGKSKRIPRPGLVASYVVGPGPVTLFWQSGTFGDAIFAVSGTKVYRDQALLGTVALGTPRIAASDAQLVVVSGGLAYCYDGATLSQITDPDLPQVSDVFYLSGRFYFYVQASDQWYFSAIGDATSIDGLAFATAEAAPDPNVGGAVLYDEMWFFGKQTIEPWSLTTDANNPLQRTQGRRFGRGCLSQRSIQTLDNSVFWVGDDKVVYRAAGVPQRISTHGIESKLRSSSDVTGCIAFVMTFDGHSVYVLSIPGEGTFAFDVATSQWSEWSSFGRTLFRINSAVMVNGVPYLGDAETGTVWVLDATVYADGPDPMERVASASVDITGATARCDNIMLNCARGVGPADNSVPVVSLRWSDDQGESWTDWFEASLGQIGDYRKKAVWRRLGLMQSPGRDFEFRCTDPVQVTFLSAVINERQAA